MGNPYAIKAALENPELSATVVHAIARNTYKDDDWYNFDPATLYLDFRDIYGAESASEVINKLAAIQTLMLSNAFFKRVDAFLGICNTLASGEPFFSVFDPVTTEEAAWGIAEASLNRDMIPFGYGVKTYLNLLLKQDGYTDLNYPDIFSIVFEPVNMTTKSIRDLLVDTISSPNTTVVDEYVNEELIDMLKQFDDIPSLSGVDDILLKLQKEKVVGVL